MLTPPLETETEEAPVAEPYPLGPVGTAAVIGATVWTPLAALAFIAVAGVLTLLGVVPSWR